MSPLTGRFDKPAATWGRGFARNVVLAVVIVWVASAEE
jgi:hypothetical protein